jgi:hypothetical protein
VASKLATAPPANRARKSAASSTVTSPPLLHERLGQRRHAGDHVAGDELRHVDDVRADVAERARPRLVLPQAPDQRELRVDDPVLQVGRAHMAHLSEPALLHEPARQRHRRHAPVVEADHAAHAALPRPLGRRDHRARLVHGVRERLLTEHVLAGVQRGDRDLGVRVAGRAYVDQLHVVATEQPLPVGFGAAPAQLGRGGLHGVGVAAADHSHVRVEREVEEPARRAPGLRVGRAHEGVADHADAKSGHDSNPRGR